MQAVEAALDEALLRDKLTVCDVDDDSQRQAMLAHQKLCAVAGCRCAISSPLRNQQGQVVGAWIILGDNQMGHRSDVDAVLCQRPTTLEQQNDC